jgi:hypothetical protein
MNGANVGMPRLLAEGESDDENKTGGADQARPSICRVLDANSSRRRLRSPVPT